MGASRQRRKIFAVCCDLYMEPVADVPKMVLWKARESGYCSRHGCMGKLQRVRMFLFATDGSSCTMTSLTQATGGGSATAYSAGSSRRATRRSAQSP